MKGLLFFLWVGFLAALIACKQANKAQPLEDSLRVVSGPQDNGDNDFLVEINSSKKNAAGKSADISIIVKNINSHSKLETVHEKKMHLFLMDEQLTWFDHLHPQEGEDGNYNISAVLPSGGKYLMFIDYKFVGSEPRVFKKAFSLPGDRKAPDVPSVKLSDTVDGYQISLVNGDSLRTNQNLGLNFSIERDGRELDAQALENYLGAKAHIVMVNTGSKDLVHIHPSSSRSFPVYAETYLQQPGPYRLWVQFKAEGIVRTADFSVDVKEGEERDTRSGHSHH